MYDDELERFEADGALALPVAEREDYVENDGARIWYATYGSGEPVLLLHGGLGSGDNWGYQVAALVTCGHREVLVDSRGHGRSSRDERPFTHERMASDVLAVMDALQLRKVAVVGWSDGAIVAMILAMRAPERVAAVFFFGGNMDLSGTKEIATPDPLLTRMWRRHSKDYDRLSPTSGQFEDFAAAVVLMMETQPNYSASDLGAIRVPVTIALAVRDEFITREHAEYLARCIPGAKLLILPDVSHFAPLQRPQQFNDAVLAFLGSTAEAASPIGRG
jgi:pimeloyl-ACP methyl ester carboxylesterase